MLSQYLYFKTVDVLSEIFKMRINILLRFTRWFFFLCVRVIYIFFFLGGWGDYCLLLCRFVFKEKISVKHLVNQTT